MVTLGRAASVAGGGGIGGGHAPFGAPYAPKRFTAAATRGTIGATNGNAVPLTVDDLRLDAAALPAP